jgi:hypothetical protein
MLINSKRRNSWDDIFEREDDGMETNHVRNMRDRGRRLDLGYEVDQNFEPKPYQYGLVGTQAPMVSPPNSPPPARMTDLGTKGIEAHQAWLPEGYQGYSPDGNQGYADARQSYMHDGQQWAPDGAQGYAGNGAHPRVPSSPGFETPGGQGYHR